MDTTNPVRLEIVDAPRGLRILAEFADGSTTVWTEAKTERGAKTRLTQLAKQCGLTVKGNYAS